MRRSRWKSQLNQYCTTAAGVRPAIPAVNPDPANSRTIRRPVCTYCTATDRVRIGPWGWVAATNPTARSAANAWFGRS